MAWVELLLMESRSGSRTRSASRSYVSDIPLVERASSPQPSPPKEEREKTGLTCRGARPCDSNTLTIYSSFGEEGWGEEAPSSSNYGSWYRRDRPKRGSLR